MMYSLTFTGNPGYLKPIEIDSTLDGVRPTTNSSTAVWADGMTGEFTDYFATQCEHVYVDIAAVTSTVTPTYTSTGSDIIEGNSPTMLGNLNVYAKLDAMTATEKKLLKKCLGDSDGDSTNNVEVYDWDYGAVKYWSEVGDTYLMSGTPHAIFTTDGKAERVYYDLNEDSAYNHTETAAVAYFDQFSNTLYMSFDTSCETAGGGIYGNIASPLGKVEPCLQKGDLIFVADANWGKTSATLSEDASAAVDADNKFFGGGDVSNYRNGFADTADLYTITKIWTAQMTSTTSSKEDRYRITVDKNINWDGSTIANPDFRDSTSTTGYVQIVKFTPATTGTFTYVSQCSNRGLCNGDDALCECFKGYTNDNCDTQSSLAV